MSEQTRTRSRTSLRQKNQLFNAASAAWERGDLAQAFALFKRAADLGDRASQVDLGYFYDNGLSVKRNKSKAIEYYHKAYQQGDAGAANNIGTVYRDLGDRRKMLWWFRRAAALGDLDVLLDLGWRYETGKSVPQSSLKAKELYHRVLSDKNATKGDKLEARARLSKINAKVRREKSSGT
jgi:TPR repeat protein